MKNKNFLVYIGLLMGIMICPGILLSQERQVPVCENAQVISPAQAAYIEFFQAYPGFQQATLFMTADSTFFMEILYQKEGSVFKDRKPMTKSEIDQVCKQLIPEMASSQIEQPDIDRDGRRKLIASTMAYSLFYYAWATPYAFDTESGKGYTASYLLIGSAGYFIPMLATQKGTITNGMAKGYTYGCFLGIGHGLALGTIMSGEFDDNVCLGISVVTSIGEGLGGLAWAKKKKLDRSYMRTIGSLGTWGLAYGLGIPAMAESEESFAYAISSLAVSAAGIYAGNRLAMKYKPADGDVTITNGLGFLGAFFPIALVNTITDEEGTAPAYIGGAIAGSAAGLTLGFLKTSKLNYSRSQGNLVMLGELAGGLIGSGIAVLVDAGGSGALWLAGGGLLGGFLLADGMIQKQHRAKKTVGLNLDFEFNPIAIKNMVNRNIKIPQPGKEYLSPDMAKITLHL